MRKMVTPLFCHVLTTNAALRQSAAYGIRKGGRPYRRCFPQARPIIVAVPLAARLRDEYLFALQACH